MPRSKKAKKITKSVGSSKRNYSSYRTGLFNLNISESYISLILGFFVVIATVILVFTFSKNRTYDRINTAASTYQELTSTVQKESPKSKTYEVKAGDNLWSIAENVYGSGYNYVDLIKANNLKNPSVISAGTKLIIPDVPKIIVQNSESSMTNAPPSITGSSYTIHKGDYLWSIAVRAYGDGFKWPEIARVNNIQNPDLIFSGNVLKLPR